MDFAFTEEQRAIAEVVTSLLTDQCSGADLRRLMASDQTHDTARWNALMELGLSGILVPENKGGLGLSETDFVLVARACGHAALPEPLVEQAGVVLPLLSALDHPLAAAWLGKALSGQAIIALAHPVNPFVSGADNSDAFLIEKDGELHLVTRDQVTLNTRASIDPFRRLSTISATLTAETVVAKGSACAPLLAQALERSIVFSAAQCLGLAERSVELAVAYANERTQFGKPIATYQAVKHLLASAQVKIEFARPVVYAAAAEIKADNALSRARASHAKLAAVEAASLAARTAIQVHGAMGYSWEVDVHFLLKRGLALGGSWGDESFHRERVLACALSSSAADIGFACAVAKDTLTHAA